LQTSIYLIYKLNVLFKIFAEKHLKEKQLLIIDEIVN